MNKLFFELELSNINQINKGFCSNYLLQGPLYVN